MAAEVPSPEQQELKILQPTLRETAQAISDHNISNNIALQKADNKWQRPSDEHDEDKV